MYMVVYGLFYISLHASDNNFNNSTALDCLKVSAICAISCLKLLESSCCIYNQPIMIKNHPVSGASIVKADYFVTPIVVNKISRD